MTDATTLTPTARKLLRAALDHKDHEGFLFVNSGGILGGPAMQVRKSLLNAGFIEAVEHTGKGDLFDGKALEVTEAGRAALADANAAHAKEVGEGIAAAVAERHGLKVRTPRENSKQAQMVAMLRRPEGATVDEVASAFGWKAHTTRAAISTLPKKDAALKPTSEKVDGRGRVYRLPAAE
jgi:hypothetical protein